MAGLKYFVRRNEFSLDEFPTFDFFSAEVSSTQDLLNNIPLLNVLFKFPEDSNQPNTQTFAKLSILQTENDNCEDAEYFGPPSRTGFIEYYTKQQTLLDELARTDIFTDHITEITVFDSKEDMNAHMKGVYYVDWKSLPIQHC